MGLTQTSHPIGMSNLPLQFEGSPKEFNPGHSADRPFHKTCCAEIDYLRNTSEEALVIEAKGGDQQAFMELCNRYDRPLKNRIFRIVRSQQDSEDVYQETLLQAYKHLDSFRGRCSFHTWITRIAINTALMLLRRHRTRSEISLEIVGEGEEIIDRWEIRDPSENPEQLYRKKQMSQMLSNAVTKLPAVYRAIVEQVHRNELKVCEAARTLGLKEAAVKSRLFRARALLRRQLQNHILREA